MQFIFIILIAALLYSLLTFVFIKISQATFLKKELRLTNVKLLGINSLVFIIYTAMLFIHFGIVNIYESINKMPFGTDFIPIYIFAIIILLGIIKRVFSLPYKTIITYFFITSAAYFTVLIGTILISIPLD